MKHVLIFLVSLFLMNSVTAANEEQSTEIILTETNNNDPDFLPEEDTTPGSPRPRTPLFKPAYAYLSGSTVSIDFTATFSTVVVTVTQAVTGEVVATRTLFNPSTLNLSLEGASSGEYLLAIEADAILLEGSFIL